MVGGCIWTIPSRIQIWTDLGFAQLRSTASARLLRPALSLRRSRDRVRITADRDRTHLRLIVANASRLQGAAGSEHSTGVGDALWFACLDACSQAFHHSRIKLPLDATHLLAAIS